MKKCGYIAVLGETNAGKSTLVNRLVGQKVSIVSRKVQTTVSRILGIAIEGESQIILADTPGFVSNRQSEVLEKISWEASREAVCILFLVDVNKSNLDKSIALLQRIPADKKVTLVLNKVDLIHKPKLLGIADRLCKEREFDQVFMISSLNGSGVGDLKKYLADIVPEGEWEFDGDEITDSDFAKYTSEITREHLYHRVHQEIPYQCKVVTTSYEEKPNGKIFIEQDILVKSVAHRIILVGQGGSKLKAIGSAAREELSELLGKEINLKLNVVVESK